jgi:branched-chain amino acid transport system substrate-binding protein
MSTRRNTLVRILATGLAASHAAGGSWAQGRPATRRFVLGQSVPLTGAASEIGLALAAGAKLYIDTFNARRGNPGYSFELRQLDDGYNAARAGANAAKLIDGGVDLLFGFVGTASSDAGAAVARERDAIFFAPFAAADTLRGANAGNVFHVRPSLADEAFKMVRHCATLGQDRIAVVAEDDAMGRAGLAAVAQALAELGQPPLVGSVLVPANTTKVDAAVATLLKAQPHAIIQVSLFTTTAAFTRSARKAGYGGVLMTFSVVGIDPLFAALGKDIGGVVMSQVVPSPRAPTTPIVKEYLSAVDNTDQTASYESLEGFIAAKTLVEAVQRAGGKSATQATLRRAMGSMTDYDVGGLRINLRAGLRDSVRTIDLITLTADGRVVR